MLPKSQEYKHNRPPELKALISYWWSYYATHKNMAGRPPRLTGEYEKAKTVSRAGLGSAGSGGGAAASAEVSAGISFETLHLTASGFFALDDIDSLFEVITAYNLCSYGSTELDHKDMHPAHPDYWTHPEILPRYYC